ncbi:sigma-70 family RNA polymerase sigma factor [Intrasporangium calvum]|uniref:Sigma-70 family RNA polymerase sigma factor n=1 Tax=Intrasporangium calvum TaxID=53358 RepID=A0ABT5GH73_9MICO|nr:sigma-70 family RNA polymerase sigma factor [Intrasporangium calvum]MDC5697602.1 sigma-70 family RNA polymerase sigma factor [Intrasporangium calvum]
MPDPTLPSRDPSPPRADARTRELIATVLSSSSSAERQAALDEAARLHMPLARALARRYAGRGLEREDLEQVAFLALLKAVHRFDLAQATEFGAYATPTITGELRRHFRDHGWLVRPPRELQERRQLVAAAQSRLTQLLGHEPDETELAADLGIGVEEVREALVAAENLRPASLDATADDDGQTGEAGRRQTGQRASAEPAMEDAIVVRMAIAALPPRERAMVALRFDTGLSQAEIAEAMGMTPMQVSRTLRRVLGMLRDELQSGAAPD